jgi:hypothetical protein
MKVTWFVLTICCSLRLLFAQPQAPVVWGEARWAHLAGWPGLPQIVTLRVIPMGDTLLFTARNSGGPVSDTILVCSSFDNGQTFTPWIPISDGSSSVAAFFTGSAGRFYAFFNVGTIPPDETWLRVSADGGLTWGAVQQYRTNTYLLRGFAVGHEVLAVFRSSLNNNLRTEVIHSTDFGQSWSAPVVVDTADFYLAYCGQSIAFTQSHRLLIEEPVPSRSDLRLYVALGDNTSQNWTTFRVLPCPYYSEYGCQNRATVIGDTALEAAGVLGVFGDWDASAPMTPFHFRSGDVSAGWEDCVMIGPPRSIPPIFTTYYPVNIGHGKLWMVGWERHIQGQWNYFAVHFSANHGKNWYPVQVPADSLAQAGFFSGQIRGNQIDLYWAQGCCGQAVPWDYRMVTGTITPDTTLPQLGPVGAPPDTVRIGQPLSFSVRAADNDTLSEVRLLIVGMFRDTLRYEMVRGADDVYGLTWVVPDSGYYRYWFEAEDFWENIATLPDSGTFHFVTEGWSSSSDFIFHPSAFSLSVFPNPCNTWPTLTLSPEWFARGPVEVTVYNAMGQEVIQQTVTGTSVAFSPRIPVASGTYLLQVSSRQHSALQKFVVLK